jgi:hypothetical protein
MDVSRGYRYSRQHKGQRENNVTRLFRFVFSSLVSVAGLLEKPLLRVYFFLFFVSVVPTIAAEQKTAETSNPAAPSGATTAPAPSPGIPLEEVAVQGTQVENLIRGFATNLADANEVETRQKFLPQVRADLARELKSTTAILKGQPALETLQTQEEIWHEKHLQLTTWLNILTDRATKLQVALSQLKKLHEIWSRTRDTAKASKAPDPILQQIDATLATIEAAQQPHDKQRDELLNLQSKVAEPIEMNCSSCSPHVGRMIFARWTKPRAVCGGTTWTSRSSQKASQQASRLCSHPRRISSQP